MSTLSLLKDPKRYLFFTGKGGVGKTSLSCAAALSLADQGKRILLVSTDPASNLPANLSALPRAEVPLRSFDMVGLPALRALLEPEPASTPAVAISSDVDEAGLAAMVDDLARAGRGLIMVMVMGKGGVGKTTVAAAIAIGLVKRGHAVHLTTTDPAAHVSLVVDGTL